MGESKGHPIAATVVAPASLTIPDTDNKHTSTLLLSSDAKGTEPVLSSSSAAATTTAGGGNDSTADSKSVHPSSAVDVASSSSSLSAGFARAALPHHLPPLAAFKVCALLPIL